MAEYTGAEGLPPSPRRVSWASLSELLELSPDALVVINQAGTLVQANEQAATLFGYHLPEVLGQPLELLLPERLRTVHVAHRQHYFAAPAARPMGTQLELIGRRQRVPGGHQPAPRAAGRRRRVTGDGSRARYERTQAVGRALTRLRVAGAGASSAAGSHLRGHP
jgi:PAS domain S-box-containing protein